MEKGIVTGKTFSDMTCPQLKAGIKLDVFSLQQG